MAGATRRCLRSAARFLGTGRSVAHPSEADDCAGVDATPPVSGGAPRAVFHRARLGGEHTGERSHAQAPLGRPALLDSPFEQARGARPKVQSERRASSRLGAQGPPAALHAMLKRRSPEPALRPALRTAPRS